MPCARFGCPPLAVFYCFGVDSPQTKMILYHKFLDPIFLTVWFFTASVGPSFGVVEGKTAEVHRGILSSQ